jgi:carboxylate-amine ligase
MATSLISSAIPWQRRTVRPRPAPSGAAFASGGEFTVGAEEELFLVDSSGALAPTGTAAVIEQLSTSSSEEHAPVTPELFAAEVEFATSVCTDAGEIADQLLARRTGLFATGARAMACGLHPDAPFGEAALTPADRYRLIGDSLAGLLRTPTAAFQVHVGLPDERLAVLAYRGIRHRLAVLQALAACSPFWHGQDSGLASARWAVISSYPRGGVPPVVHSWDEYASLVDVVTAAAEVPDYTHVWWDARLQPRLGTIEVRVMDAQPSLAAAAGLAALTQGLVRHVVENPLAVDLPGPVLAENSFRVARHGLEARITDVDGTLRPVRDLAARMLREARSALSADGLDGPLAGVEELLVVETGCARQRRLHAQHGMAAVVADLVGRTARGR